MAYDVLIYADNNHCLLNDYCDPANTVGAYKHYFK